MSCNLMAQKKFQIDLNSLSTLRPLTISFASWILETCPDILHDQERSSLLEAVKATINDSILINPPLVSSELKQDKRSFDDVFIPGTLSQLKVYTDYEFFKNLINKLDFQFQIVDAREEADFLFLAHNIRDFYSISQRVNSFPYEGGFVCKDLLILTVRQCCYQTDGTGGHSAPNWWLPCYDLSTEFHLFAAEYKRRAAICSTTKSSEVKSDSGEELINLDCDGTICTNSWIVKPAQGARGIGHKIIASGDESGLQQIAQTCPMMQLEYKGDDVIGVSSFRQKPVDRIAQLLVTQPLLVMKRKFDLRLFVFVRSFVPFEAYMHELFFARLANREYDPALVGEDEQVALTVCAYSEDENIASLQERLFRGQLRYALAKEGFHNWDKLVISCRTLCRELFQSAAPSIGVWPRSAAYYSLDVILEVDDIGRTNSEVTPRLLEVNFMGDWSALKTASETETESVDSSQSRPTHHLEKVYNLSDWVNDLFTCLGTSVNLDEHPRLVRL